MLIHKQKCFLVVLFIVLQGSLCFAQKLIIDLIPLKTAKGLSQNSIQDIFSDSYGLMWFGTQDGLNLYDGYKVTVYKHVHGDPNSIAANSILDIAEDSNTNLWIGTRKDGLSRYNRRSQTFTTFKHNPKDKNTLSSNNISVVLRAGDGKIWVGTDEGLNILDPQSGKVERVTHQPKNPYSISSSQILSLFMDASGSMWVGTTKGLNRYDKAQKRFHRYFLEGEKDDELVASINAIVEDEQHNIWVGTEVNLNRLDRKTGRFQSYSIRGDKFSAGGYNPIYTFAKTTGNRFWIGTNTTLQLFDATTRKLISVEDEVDDESNMPNDGVYSILEDRAGTLWVGTSSVGVLKYDRNRAYFPPFKTAAVKKPAAKNIIRAIEEDVNVNLYLATDAGLVYATRFDRSYKTYQHNPKDPNSLLSNYTTSVVKSKKDGMVWVGTYNSGLDRLDPKTGKFKHFVAGYGPGKINSNAIICLLEDQQGKIWIGTSYGGLNVYDPKTGLVEKLMHNAKDANTVCDNVIYSLYEDKAGNIWIGGYSKGVSIYNPVSKTFKHLNTRNSALSSDVISAFYEDTKGNMYIGTLEGGLNSYNVKTGKFSHFTERNGFLNNNINYINADAEGLLWVTTNQGLSSLNPKTGVSRNYGYENGLNSLEFNPGSGKKLKDGRMIVGSVNGFNGIDPKQARINKHKPDVILTGISLFNKPVLPGGADSILHENILTTKRIEVKTEFSVLTLHFAALNYTIPEQNKYAYRLDGFDEDWRYVGNQQEATYTNLDPGKYVFRVKAANNDGVWNDKETRLELVVVPPFYQTRFFQILAAILLVSALIELYYLRITYITLQKAKLEHLVRNRTKKIESQQLHLQNLNQALQQQTEALRTQSKAISEQAKELSLKTKSLEIVNQELLKQKDEEQKARLMAEAAQELADKANLAKGTFLATMSHELRTPLNGVLGMASLLSKTALDTEQEEYTTAIVTSGKSLMSVINDVLDYSKIESGMMELEAHAFDLRKCIADVFSIFAPKVQESGIKLVSDLDASIPEIIVGDSHRLSQVLINLVGNGVKFTSKGSVSVKAFCVHQTAEKIRIGFDVEDTGIGIDPEQLSKLFKPFNQIDSTITRKFGGTGLGLVICEKLIRLMGGEISVKSFEGSGSCFSFEIDCDIAQLGSANRKMQQDVKAAASAKRVLSEGFAKSYPFRILIAEDNMMNQRLITRVITKLGYAPDLAVDGQNALDMVAAGDYDLVLMDVQMPVLDGIQAAELIRAQYGSRPLIMAMTANAMSQDIERCMQAGMDDYISKPLDIELLVNKLVDLSARVKQEAREV
jgi:signal transduction histidine kinase/ligand-binding sensor domain-containing protein/ActR/RegA family two-component response regulator